MLVLNIQFWQGDKQQAMALARLLADLEPQKREDVIVMFSARFDCEHDTATIAYVGKKFKTYAYKSRPHRTGWPGGPNDLMAQSYMHCIEQQRWGKMMYDGIMFIEADCIPLRYGWLDELLAEWKECRARGKMFLGAVLTREDCGCEHMNGNLIMAMEYWRQNKDIFAPGGGGWDAELWPAMKNFAMPSKLIWSDYGLGKPGYNEWKDCDWLFAEKRYVSKENPLYGIGLQPCWFHGPKDMRGIQCVREKLKIS